MKVTVNSGGPSQSPTSSIAESGSSTVSDSQSPLLWARSTTAHFSGPFRRWASLRVVSSLGLLLVGGNPRAQSTAVSSEAAQAKENQVVKLSLASLGTLFPGI